MYKFIRMVLLSGVALLGGCNTAHGFYNPGLENEMTTAALPAAGIHAANLQIVGNYKPGADQRLLDIIERAARYHPEYRVEVFSGYRAGDKRFHGKRMAIDIRLVEVATGKALPNYQNAASFRAYEVFAQTARRVQRQHYPELNASFRWGGYFSGRGYGAVDLMHFDLGGEQIAMGGGSWSSGLTPAQRNLWPGMVSVGMGAAYD